MSNSFSKKGTIVSLILLVLLLGILLNMNKVTEITSRLINSTPNIDIPEANAYSYNQNYSYVQKTTTFIPYSRQDVMNIFYSILDNGYDTFTFYCPSEYKNCLNDVEDISNNQTTITNIGNFVHPYNNFSSLKVATDSLGKVEVTVNKTYSQDMINAINDKLSSIETQIYTTSMNTDEKIRAFHDYVINNTEYDINDDAQHSGDAYGLLFGGKVKCAGYADTMAIELARLGVQNYKVASDEHVWNAVYLNNVWKHLDLTWDDPVVTNGQILTDDITHKFYMIDTATLLSYDTTEHTFDRTVYVEVS